MANGCDYWMVFLPDLCSDSFLLFVQDSQDRTSLRDYSLGRAYRLPETLSAQQMSRRTTEGTTRFRLCQADIRPKEDTVHWQELTSRYNAFLAKADNRSQSLPISSGGDPVPLRKSENSQRHHAGRALHGSQRQLQDYVNLYESRLNAALLAVLPEPLQRATVQWVSPCAASNYLEYRDGCFLEAVGLSEFQTQLNDFWPSNGPCWDALGLLSNGIPFAPAVVLLVEAKSHIPEVRSNGCQASGQSLVRIQRALEEAKAWCGADPKTDWTGTLYQSANRIAHLFFLREKLNRPCLLFNLYFVGDPYRPTSLEEWQAALPSINNELGLTRPVPGLIELFVPALEVSEGTSPAHNIFPSQPKRTVSPEAAQIPQKPAEVETYANTTPENVGDFAAWRDRWNELASLEGAFLPEADSRIDELLALWDSPIPGHWQRQIDVQLLAARYRRRDRAAPRSGEHLLEHQMLNLHFYTLRCLNMQLIDGINAYPLSCDFAGGGRRANVEADMLLLGRSENNFRFFLCEVKNGANDPWYAAVEALRQLKLCLENPWARRLMAFRNSLPEEVAQAPVTGLVLAPGDYYLSGRKKPLALAPARKLLREFNRIYSTDLRLAVWEESRREIIELV
jgi:hypothetical protein